MTSDESGDGSAARVPATETEVRRLAFASYLLDRARKQAALSQPMNASALLSAQDAVETVLVVVAERNGLRDSFSLLGYWDELAGKKGVLLPSKEQMRHLNDCRVAIKHKGTFPLKFDVDRSVADALDFFRIVLRDVFGLNPRNLSMLEFVSYSGVRDELKKAQELLDDGSLSESVAHSALAFDVLLSDYVSNRGANGRGEPYKFSSVRASDSADRIFGIDYGAEHRNITNYVDKVSKSLDSISEATKILALGIDFDEYVLFKQLTPEVVALANGERRYYPYAEINEAVGKSLDAARWCLRFVTETAIMLSSKEVPLSPSLLRPVACD